MEGARLESPPPPLNPPMVALWKVQAITNYYLWRMSERYLLTSHSWLSMGKINFISMFLKITEITVIIKNKYNYNNNDYNGLFQ